jgi:hypothetical protein
MYNVDIEPYEACSKQEFERLIEVLGLSAPVETLRITFSDLEDGSNVAFLKFLTQIKTLKQLHLESYLNWDDDSLFHALRANKSLQKLCIDMTFVPERNVVIAKCLHRNAIPNLTVLTLESEGELTDAQVIPIAAVLAENSTLQELTIYVGRRGFRVLSNAMCTNKGLKKLHVFDLGYHFFEGGEDHMAKIGPLFSAIALNVHCALEHLELAALFLDDCAMSALAFMLLQNRTLRHLNLEFCDPDCRTGGEEEVLQILRQRQNSVLEELLLPGNYTHVGCVEEWRKKDGLEEHSSDNYDTDDSYFRRVAETSFDFI